MKLQTELQVKIPARTIVAYNGINAPKGWQLCDGRNLKDTNNLRSRIINDINITSLDLISKTGIKNNLSAYFKNLNTVAKNDSTYKSSPQIELMGIFDATSSLPLIKYGEKYDNYFEPKISCRFNPGDMKNYAGSSRKISSSNIYNINIFPRISML